jgi:hypothetical protein
MLSSANAVQSRVRPLRSSIASASAVQTMAASNADWVRASTAAI